MVISPIIWAGVIPLVCIVLTICFRKYLLIKYKNTEEVQSTRLISPKTLIQAVCFILPTISGVLIFNAVFLICSKNLIMIESVMDYSDSLATAISLVATMAVAFFQYRIQENIEQEHNLQTKQSNRFQKDFRDIEKRHHIQELCSERLRSLKPLEGIKGIVTNNEIVESHGLQDVPPIKESLRITIGDKNDISNCKFYHPFFSLCDTKEWKDYIYCNDDTIKVYEFSPYHLSFGIDIKESSIIDFITYPAKKKCAQTQQDRPKLRFKFEPHVFDSSIGVMNDQNSDEKKQELVYRLEFDIEPSNTGYTKFGRFEVYATNARLTVVDFPIDY